MGVESAAIPEAIVFPNCLRVNPFTAVHLPTRLQTTYYFELSAAVTGKNSVTVSGASVKFTLTCQIFV